MLKKTKNRTHTGQHFESKQMECCPNVKRSL